MSDNFLYVPTAPKELENRQFIKEWQNVVTSLTDEIIEDDPEDNHMIEQIA